MQRILVYQLFAAIAVTVGAGIVTGFERLGIPDVIAFPVALAGAVGLFVACVRNVTFSNKGSAIPSITRLHYFGTGVTPESEAYARALEQEAYRDEGRARLKRRPGRRRKRRNYRL